MLSILYRSNPLAPFFLNSSGFWIELDELLELREGKKAEEEEDEGLETFPPIAGHPPPPHVIRTGAQNTARGQTTCVQRLGVQSRERERERDNDFFTDCGKMTRNGSRQEGGEDEMGNSLGENWEIIGKGAILTYNNSLLLFRLYGHSI